MRKAYRVGKCVCCDHQILVTDHMGRPVRTCQNYRMAYVVYAGGGHESRMKVPCCSDCLDTLDPQEVHQNCVDGGQQATAYYTSLEQELGIVMTPVRIEKLGSVSDVREKMHPDERDPVRRAGGG